ncbi:MAG TPA: DUF3263 domain-containing protein [Egibacteraceae bacterium]|nr:DUF3263 domain-containing protein [Egibacteraceae bacterium]
MGQPLPPEGGLDARSRALLDFEREWPAAGAETGKEQAIKEAFGFSKARYHQLLAKLIDSAEAYAYDPLTVLRLRRRRGRLDRRRTAEAVRERR